MSDLFGSALAHVERGGLMTEAPFYDLAMTGDGEPAMLDLANSPWLPIYQEAASWIPNTVPVVDLGCGTGRFIEQMRRAGNVEHITGIDFSQPTLDEAERYVRRKVGKTNTAKVTFELADLREWQPRPDRNGRTFYTCLEVLEHLEDDLDLIRRIPPAHEFVFSVPNYLSASHQRAFQSPGDVWERYQGLLHIRRYSLVEFSVKNVVHVLHAERRNDSW